MKSVIYKLFYLYSKIENYRLLSLKMGTKSELERSPDGDYFVANFVQNVSIAFHYSRPVFVVVFLGFWKSCDNLSSPNSESCLP